MTRPVDALVVGLGPAGSATAIRLARAGLRVAAVDRAVFPRDKPCSEYLSPEAVHQLEALGALDRVAPRGVRLDGATVVGPRGARLCGLFRATAPPDRPPAGLSVARHVLDAELAAVAREAGVAVYEDTRLIDVLRDGRTVAGAVVRHAGRDRPIAARVVIGADGLRSAVSRLLGGRRTEPLRRYAFVAHVAGVRGLGTTAEMHVGPHGYVGLNAIGPDLANVAVVVPAGRARRAAGDAEAFWYATLESFDRVRGRVPRLGVVRAVLPTGPCASRARCVAADGALLVGDAAGFFDPFTGEGIGAALRDAALAAPVVEAALARRAQPAAADLRPYRTARRREVAGRWAVERLIGYGMLWPGLFDRAVGRLERRGLAHTLVGVTGAMLPARTVLNPGFLLGMIV